MSRPVDDGVLSEVERMIDREQKLIGAARTMFRSTDNPSVRQSCESEIKEYQKNVAYLENKLQQLRLRQAAAADTSLDTEQSALALAPPRPNITRLELFKYNDPHMGPRIQLMLQQLDFKLSLEKEYKAGIYKLQQLYKQDGDRKSRSEAAANLSESSAKIALLTRSLKRYSDIHLNIDDLDDSESEYILPNSRRPISGVLQLTIKQIAQIDHSSSSTWSRNAETYVVIKVENQVVAQTRSTRSSIFNEDFSLPVDKANEVEILVYDKTGSSQTPVAIMWLRISDIVEAIRRKRNEMQNKSGWANAATVQQHQSQYRGARPDQSQTGNNLHVPSLPTSQPGLGGSAKTGPVIPTDSNPSKALAVPGGPAIQDPTIEDWFILEPAGRIQLKLGFEKTTNGVKRSYMAYNEGLGRHNAIRKQEEVQEVHGHQFAHQRFYNIMVCAICGDFMTYPYQCMECQFACHRKCVSKVVTRCLSKPATDADRDELNHRIPHRMEPASNMSANWCAHCGMILPLGKKNVRKCGECGVMCHSGCVRFVPDFCGMTMERAYQIVSEIKSTRIRQVTKAAASARVEPPNAQQRAIAPPARPARGPEEFGTNDAYKPYASGRATKNFPPARPQTAAPRTEKIKRKQVGSVPYAAVSGLDPLDEALRTSRLPSADHGAQWQQQQQQQQQPQQPQQRVNQQQRDGPRLADEKELKRLDRMSMGAPLDDFSVEDFLPSDTPSVSDSAETRVGPSDAEPKPRPTWGSQDYDKSSEYEGDSYDTTRMGTGWDSDRASDAAPQQQYSDTVMEDGDGDASADTYTEAETEAGSRSSVMDSPAQRRQAEAEAAAHEEALREARTRAEATNAQMQARAARVATDAERQASSPVRERFQPQEQYNGGDYTLTPSNLQPQHTPVGPGPGTQAQMPSYSQTQATGAAASAAAAAAAAAMLRPGAPSGPGAGSTAPGPRLDLNQPDERPMSVYADRPVSTLGLGSAAGAGAGAGAQKKRRRKVGLDDFSFLAVLGKGNFGKVMLAESKHSSQLYAIKVLKKNYILENREIESMRSEKRVFLIANRENHPFLVNMAACFQTENRIYFVMDYVSGGDLMYHIQKELFTPRQAQFYAAEVLSALKHFHDNDVIYRDLKLDNILLTLDGHIKVADYGLCKEEMGFGKTTGTFCGTPEFMAPEILLDQKYGRSVDWWALGVLIYQMLLGKSPFHGKDDEEVYDSILSDEPLYPIHMRRESVSILQQLLTRDPAKRLGCGDRDAFEIMEHPYFGNIDFDDLVNLRLEPPFKPHIDSPTDVRFFDKEFTSETPALTPMNSTIEAAMQEQFRGFSYVQGDAV